MRALLRYLAQGTLVAVPLAITLYVVITSVTFIDGLAGFGVPGLGLAATLGLLLGLGFVTSSVIGTRLVALGERWLSRVPLVKILYQALKELVGAFVGDKRGFDEPVRVELGGGMVGFGFVTRDAVPLAGLEQHVAVYFPQSYNVAGNVVAVPTSSVTRLGVKSSELMTFVVSGGIAGLGAAAPGAADASRGAAPSGAPAAGVPAAGVRGAPGPA